MAGRRTERFRVHSLATVALGVAVLVAAAAATPFFNVGSEATIKVTAAVDEILIEPGGAALLPITLEFPPTLHLNSRPAPSFAVKAPSGLSVSAIELQGEHYFDDFLEAELYEGKVTVLVGLSAAASLSGSHTLQGDLTYYPCSDADMTCFEKIDPVRVQVSVGEGAVSAGGSSSAPGVEGGYSPLKDPGASLADRVSDSFGKSLLLAYALVFLGGILASFTPCVYPMIPITVAVIGAGSAGSRSRGFKLSLVYVLGIAITYSVLGAAAAGTGAAFGSFTQTFPVLIGIGLLLCVLGTSMFGFFEIQPPAFLANLQSKRGQGTVGILLMGAITGLVASPCLGPVLLALLAWIAKTGDVLQGFTLLFVFALGMGLLLIAIGTFAGVLAALPKSGGWMVRVKELLGLILFGAGVYYVGLALATVGVPEKATWLVALGLALAVLGFAVKGGQKSESEEAATPAASGVKRHLRAGVGVIMVAVGAYLAIVGLSMSGVTPAWLGTSPSGTASQQEGGVAWSGSYESAIERAQARNMPVMIDFTADWCVYCKKLDSDVFTDERVVAESDRFVTIKVDADRHKDIVRAHEVLGLPTIVFLDSAGAEAARIESYVSADAFLEKMKGVR